MQADRERERESTTGCHPNVLMTENRNILHLREFTSNFFPFCNCNTALKWQRIYLVLTVVTGIYMEGMAELEIMEAEGNMKKEVRR